MKNSARWLAGVTLLLARQSLAVTKRMNNLPDLYFLTRTQLKEESGQCDCSDCDCACVSQNGMGLIIRRPLLLETWLYPAPGIQITKLDSENFIVAGGKTSPAVLSSSCLDLLKSFPAQTGTVLQQIQNSCWNVEQVESTIQSLIMHGVLVDDLDAASRLSETASPVLSAWIHMTSHCNLACHYCYVSNTTEKLSKEVGHGIVDSIFRSVRSHSYSAVKLKYAGGEPLLNFSTLIDNYQYAKTLGAESSTRVEGKILTNGVLLNAGNIHQLIENELSLTISLDGTESDHDANRPMRSGDGSFAQVKKGLLLALEYGLKPSISITISSANVAGLPKLVDWLLDLDLQFTFNFYRENELSKNRHLLNFDNRQLIETLLNTYQIIETRKPDFRFWNALGDRVNLQAEHTSPCSIGKNYLVFDVQGKIAQCQMEIKNTLGDYTAPDPVKIMQKAPGGLKNNSVNDKLGCSDCEWRGWCAGGCPILAKQTTGSYSAKSPYCEIYKEIIPVLLRLDAKSLLYESKL
jgi:uncharacterized protein